MLTWPFIHWQALEKHFLMVPLVFRYTNFWGKKCIFWIFLKNSVLEGLTSNCVFLDAAVCLPFWVAPKKVALAWYPGIVGGRTRPVTTRWNMWTRLFYFNLTSVHSGCLLFMFVLMFVLTTSVAPGCLFNGYFWDLPSKTSCNSHVSPRRFCLWEPQVLAQVVAWLFEL
jgi:hypothetical protein